MGQSNGPPPLGRHFLDEWSAARGPLFEDPRAATCRIFAVIVTAGISREAMGRELRLRAARVLEEALAPLPASNRPATRGQRARVNMALVDIRRALREAGHWNDITDDIERILDRAAPGPGLTERLRTRAWAELLAAALQGERESVQLRAARTILARTRDAARKVGRERPASPDSSEGERDRPDTDAPAPEARDDSHTGLHAQQGHESSTEHPGRAPP